MVAMGNQWSSRTNSDGHWKFLDQGQTVMATGSF